MSSASKSVNITFLQKMGTFTPSIQSPDGDLYQEYQKNGDVVTVYPDFSQTQPKLYFVVISSRSADGITTPVSMQFFFNETEIPFNSAGNSTGLKCIAVLLGVEDMQQPGQGIELYCH